MNVYVALGLHLVFAILWFFDSRTLQRRRDIKRYYEAEEKMNAMLDQAAKTLIAELDTWRLEKEKNKTPNGMELHELSQKIAYEQMKSRWNHPTNNRRTDFDIDITHILEEKMAKRKKKPGPWGLISWSFQDRELGGPNSGMWKKPESDE